MLIDVCLPIQFVIEMRVLAVWLSPLRISTSNGLSPPNDITIYNYTIKKFKFKPKRYLHISTSYQQLVKGSATDYFGNIKFTTKFSI